MENYLHGLLDESADPVIQKYLDYIRTQIPQPKKKKKVLVIGAGMAGMVAGAMLKQVGHEVTIAEANTRVGGRIKTFRNTEGKKYFEDDSLYCEAGAMRIPSIHLMVMEYIKQLELKTEPFYYVSVNKEQAIAYKDGTRRELPEQERNSLLFVNYLKVIQSEYYQKGVDVNKLLDYHLETSPNNFENQRADQLLGALLNPLKKFLAQNPHKNWPLLIERYGNYSMMRFLMESLYSQNAIEMIAVLQNLESRLAYDFIQSFIESNVIKDDTQFCQIVGGTDMLTTRFFEKHQLHDQVYFDCHVTKLWINEHTGKVKVTTDREKDHKKKDQAKDEYVVQNQRIDTEEFDEVIVAIPFSAFRMVHVWPKFSQEKRRAIRELHYDSATKVLLEFKERWWENPPYNIIGGGTITDLANRFVYYPSQDIGKEGHGLILASYCWSDEASRWDSMRDIDRYQTALENIAVMHAPADLAEQRRIKNLAVLHVTNEAEKRDQSNNADPGNIVGGATQSWMQDPYAFGEAAIFNPGQLHLLQKHIVKTEWDGKAHFAGEHASLKHAWIEGAIESGIRTALEVNETPVYLNALLEPSVNAGARVTNTTTANVTF
ncbi:flavin monoamine oxidase family protein [Mucilaginibacter sp. KACC 22063]|uniref:flavin monoamine oxidase family protein n=1 Tax=Mucilaginibacter sp. KACC 22063 TaxID=3025666 RepID=UPI00236553C9|nr:FAD-dependent oxidoreductase [Mucilaginibacter sp. KACC 22063]WDF57165.1 FAD-dependent oxidoreductase [Mucilaginibacter sp. KACC 22063]